MIESTSAISAAMFPKLLVIDLNGVIVLGSRNPESPLYRPLYPHQMVIKPNVKIAFGLILTLGVPFVICTKQRGLSNGTLTAESFQGMIAELRHQLTPLKYQHIDSDLPMGIFSRVYVETQNPTKTEQFRAITGNYPDLKPNEICVIDDSTAECEAATSLGMRAQCTGDLYSAVCGLFDIQP